MEKETVIRPSLLSADFSSLGSDIEEAISLGIESLHYDVMDGSFVNDISFGEPIYKVLDQKFKDRISMDVHLMVINPLRQLTLFAQLGAKEITIHFEAMSAMDYDALDEFRIKYPHVRIGLAINPSTPVDSILHVLEYFDSVLVMSVVPGKGGQSFIEGSDLKIKALDEYRKENGVDLKIGVDGGINATTGPLCFKAGADYLVAGSYYFRSADKKQMLLELNRNMRG